MATITKEQFTLEIDEVIGSACKISEEVYAYIDEKEYDVTMTEQEFSEIVGSCSKYSEALDALVETLVI
jgi:hypothetical protein